MVSELLSFSNRSVLPASTIRRDDLFAALKFIRFEAQMGDAALFGLPAWAPLVIIPAAFGIMTLRFVLHFFFELFTILKPAFYQEHEIEK